MDELNATGGLRRLNKWPICSLPVLASLLYSIFSGSKHGILENFVIPVYETHFKPVIFGSYLFQILNLSDIFSRHVKLASQLKLIS